MTPKALFFCGPPRQVEGQISSHRPDIACTNRQDQVSGPQLPQKVLHHTVEILDEDDILTVLP
jgi:hypothetical protein